MSRECASCFRQLDESQFSKRRYGVLHRRCNQCRREDQLPMPESAVPLPAHVPDKLNREMRNWRGIVDIGHMKGSL